jgi:UTP:GlnB (protein PII) uridylyltransferase
MEKRKKYTDKILKYIKEKLKSSDLAKYQHLCVVVTGSYGRDEASTVSDMDWFLVVDEKKVNLNENEKKLILGTVSSIIGEYVDK